MKSFSIEKLAKILKQRVVEIDFALIFGSARHGKIKKGSDIDIAVYLNTDISMELFLKIVREVEEVTQCRCDLNILNTSSAILCFEALKGKVLFIRDHKIDVYAEFYSRTCRKYEDKMAWMDKQLALRGYV